MIWAKIIINGTYSSKSTCKVNEIKSFLNVGYDTSLNKERIAAPGPTALVRLGASIRSLSNIPPRRTEFRLCKSRKGDYDVPK